MTVDEIYRSIANNVKSVIKEEWQKAELHIEAIGKMVSNTGIYINSFNETKQIDVEDFDFQLTFDLLELQKIMTEQENNRWNKSVFSLTPDGKFNMQFIWDQELQDEIERLAKS